MLRPEITFALVSLVCLGASDFLYRWGQRWQLRGGPFMLLQNLAYLPTAFALAYVRDELVWSTPLIFGLLNGILAFVAFLCVLMALRHGEAVTVAPIVRLNFAVTAAFTVALLGEDLNLVKVMALALAAVAVIATAGGLRSLNADRRALWLALVAMFLFGCIGLFYKLALNMGAPPAGITAAQSIGVFFVSIPFAIQQGHRLPIRGAPLWLPLICGVLLSCSYVALAAGMKHGQAVVVAPIAQLSFVLTVILALVLLKERLTPIKSVGMLSAVASVLLFANS